MEFLVPSKTHLKVIAIIFILFFMTLKGNPIDLAVSGDIPVLYKINKIFTPFYTTGDKNFGSDYCSSAGGVIGCIKINPVSSAFNFIYWYVAASFVTLAYIHFGGDSE